MSVKLTASLQQRLVLTPQLRQRIEMLQMTTLELGDLIQEQLLENPLLEQVEAQDEIAEISQNILDQLADGHESFAETNGAAPPETAGGGESAAPFEETDFAPAAAPEVAAYEGEEDFDREPSRDAFEEIDYGREFQDYLDPGYKTQEIEYKEDGPTFEQFLTRPTTLVEHLDWQLQMSPAEGDMYDAAVFIIGNLDGDGRLTITNEEIAAEIGCSEELVEYARQLVMSLEPVGCGARDVKECLLAQLETQGAANRLAATLIRDHLADLQPHKLPALAKQMGLDVRRVADELQFIRTLDPYPGRRYSTDDSILITPEIYIEKVDEDYVIYFMDDGSPRLRISPSYQQMLAQGKTSREERDFIKDKVRAAVDLLRNIEHRRQTIYRVVECIVERQREFLDHGVEYLRPMMLKDIAEDIGMHLSTVSRVVNRKYAHTPQGVIELRRFFTEGMTNEDGEEVSTRLIKVKIKKLIEDEDSHNPITDDHIVQILGKDGIKLSRRTVAKYRDQMQIPGSRERKAAF
jgi:RNA polymerase sigma-54 factor